MHALPTAIRERPLIREDSEKGLFTIAAKAFTDPEIYRLERERIFDRVWLYAAHRSELRAPGDFLVRSVGGRELLVTVTGDGELRAFLNICRHKGATLCRKDKGNARQFSCIYHKWTYTNKGVLRGVALPGDYSEHFDKSEFDLFPVGIAEYRGLIFICYDPDAEDLRSFLAGFPDMFDLFLDQHEEWEMMPGAYEYTIRVNWKLLMENSVDALHVLSVHDRYFFDYLPEVMGMNPSRDTIWGNSTSLHDLGNGHAGTEMGQFTPNQDHAKRALWTERHGADRAGRMLDFGRTMALFPNGTFSEQFPQWRTYFPISADETRITAWQLVPANEDPAIREKRIAAFTSFVGPTGFGTSDDVEVLEQCQVNCRAMPQDAHLDCSRGMSRMPAKPSDELVGRVLFREWGRLMAL